MDKKNNCTLFPDFNWSICCKGHDKDYTEQTNSKFKVDWKATKCVAQHVYKEPLEAIWAIIWALFSAVVAFVVGAIFWLGVSTIGWYFWLKQKRINKIKEHNNGT